MAVAVTNSVGTIPPGAVPPGSRRSNRVTLTFSGAYSAGGAAVTAGACGLTTLDDLLVDAVSQDGAVLAVFVRSTGKVALYTAPGTEASGTVAAVLNATALGL